MMTQQEYKNRSLVLTSGSAARAFSPPIGWIQVVVAGDVVLKGEDGVAVTYTGVSAGDVLKGPFSAFTSTTSSNLRAGDGEPPPGSAAVAVGIGALNVDATSNTGRIDMLQFCPVLAAGTPMAAWADNAGASAPGVTVTDSKAVGIRWNNFATQVAVFGKCMVPSDMDLTVAPRVKVRASKIGATVGDAVTFAIAIWEQATGALHDAGASLGGTTSAMVGNATSKTVQEVSLTMTAPSSAPSELSFSIKATDGTLGTDDLLVEGIFLEYKRKLRTS